MSIIFRKDFIFLEVFFILSGLVVVRGEDSIINDHIDHINHLEIYAPVFSLACTPSSAALLNHFSLI